MTELFVKHHSWEEDFRNPFGAVKSGQSVKLALETSGVERAEVNLIFINGDTRSILMTKNEKVNIGYFQTDLNIDPSYSGIINYYFSIYSEGKKIYYGNNEELTGGEGKLYFENPKYYQITVYKDFKVPDWYKEGIVYQIFVDRFCNGNTQGIVQNPKKNSFIYGSWYDDPMYIRDKDGKIARWDFYGGNLQGIINKLDYIKSLGATVIYLNPIFESVSNHKYDTGDYKKIDPMFGDDKKFQELCVKANKRGIRIILDGVFSHTGSDSVYFNKYDNYDSVGAYQSKESSYYDWYRFQEYPDKYESWWGFDNQPNVDELNLSYKNFIITGKDSVIRKWMKLGASGWRLDVADELPDEFIHDIKKEIKSINKDSVLIGEVWEDASNKISYSERRKYLFGEELDSVTNYPFRTYLISFLKGEMNSLDFSKKIMSLYENYPKEAFYSNLNILGTHDTERILSMFEHKEEQFLKLALAVQMTMPGVPMIYYGDEAGLKGGKDPENRKPYPWGKGNRDIFKLYKRLASIRNEYEIFKKGDLRFLNLNEDILCYKRCYMDKSAFVILNSNVENKINLDIDMEDNRGIYLDILSESRDDAEINCQDSNMNIELAPLDVKILLKVY